MNIKTFDRNNLWKIKKIFQSQRNRENQQTNKQNTKKDLELFENNLNFRFTNRPNVNESTTCVMKCFS